MGELKQVAVMPGAALVTWGDGPSARSALFGIPASSMKVLKQQMLAMPNVFVLPEDFFARGVVQVGAEFFVYLDLFVRGKAFRPVASNERMVLIGTEDQLRRMRRILEVTLTGFSPEEMRGWRGPQTPKGQRRCLREHELTFLRRNRAWFATKRSGFTVPPNAPPEHPLALTEFLAKVAAHGDQEMPLRDYPPVLDLGVLNPLTRDFLKTHGDLHPNRDDAALAAYEFAIRPLDEIIEFRAFDAEGKAVLWTGYDATLPSVDATVRRVGDGTFAVAEGDGDASCIDIRVTENQAPHLLTLPAKPQAVRSDTCTIVCLGSDSGFEPEHPTTGFAICCNGQWVVVDAPVCASTILRQYGINVEDVRAIIETHAHEDHMGSSAHFLLECLATGRAFTYVAAEPVFRAAVAKIAAYRGEDEAKVTDELERRGAVRVRPGEPLRLLGAAWHFVWTVHPIPTTGFRIELDHGGRTYRIGYSSDTNRTDGFAGTDAMAAAGFLNPADDPFPKIVRDGDDHVFWEAGGSNGDPIHFHVRNWEAQCVKYGVRPKALTLMHVHPLPPEYRERYAIARPGDVWVIARQPPVAVADAAAVDAVVRSLPLRDPSYWLTRFLMQGMVERYAPGSAVVTEGSHGDSWYAILCGEAEVVIGGTRVSTLRAPAFFGEFALLGNGDGRRRATVRATGPLDVLRIPKGTFLDCVVENQLEAYFANFWARVGVLQRSRLFVGFPHGVLAALAARCTERAYAAGEVMIRQGTVGDELFVIESGEIEALRSDDNGHQQVIGVRGTGEVLGEYGVLVPGGLRTATVRAATPVKVYVLTREDVGAVIAGQLPLELRIIGVMRDRGMPVPEARAAQSA